MGTRKQGILKPGKYFLWHTGYEKLAEKVSGNNRDEDDAMGNKCSLLEHRRNEEILEEARVEPIVAVTRSSRLEWFGH